MEKQSWPIPPDEWDVYVASGLAALEEYLGKWAFFDWWIELRRRGG